MNQDATRPRSCALVIDENIRLWKKRSETLSNTKLFRTATSILCTTRTPTIKNCSLNVKLANVLND